MILSEKVTSFRDHALTDIDEGFETSQRAGVRVSFQYHLVGPNVACVRSIEYRNGISAFAVALRKWVARCAVNWKWLWLQPHGPIRWLHHDTDLRPHGRCAIDIYIVHHVKPNLISRKNCDSPVLL